MTIPDDAIIDACRGICVGLGALLLLMLARLRFTRGLPQRVHRVIYALMLFTLPVLATEVSEIGRPFVVWRLPLAFLAFGGALRWCVAAQDTIRRDDAEHML